MNEGSYDENLYTPIMYANFSFSVSICKYGESIIDFYEKKH